MIGWTLYLLGIAFTAYASWTLRGWRDEDRATKAELEKIALEREARRKWVKPPGKDYPYP